MTEIATTLEAYIDEHGMAALLNVIERICLEKAEHVATNWQDHSTASAWRRGAARIAKAATFSDWPL